MSKYFRTLFYLICFFFEDKFLYIFHPKDDDYYPVIKVIRQMLKKQLLEPFQSNHTIIMNPTYALKFQNRLLLKYLKSSPETVLPSALNSWLYDYQVTLRNIRYENGVISSFSYSYI